MTTEVTYVFEIITVEKKKDVFEDFVTAEQIFTVAENKEEEIRRGLLAGSTVKLVRTEIHHT